jgi:DNA-binding transcriptional LysR family regulator
MNTRDIEAFLAVVETGSIVAASARLNLTQPGVTRRIQSLEDMLGAELLDRQSKPLKPTAAGRLAYEHGRSVLRALEDLKSGASAEQQPTGEFRLGITPYLSEASLAEPLDRLRADFPTLSLKVMAAWTPELVEQLVRNELDAAAICLTEGIEPPEPFVAEPLGSQPIIIVASPKFDLPATARLEDLATLEDLSRCPWVMNKDGCGFRHALRRAFDAARLPFHVAVEAISPDLRLSLVARGIGIGFSTPASLAASPLRDQIRVVELKDFRLSVCAWLVHRPPAGRLAQPLAVFKDALLAELSSEQMRNPGTGWR